MKPKLIALGLGLLALSTVTSGQTSAIAPGNPSYDALVAEVHGLRGDIAQVTSASIRTQLLVGRLQLQEQRIAALSKQFDDVHTRVSTMPIGLLPMQNELKQLEEESRSPAIPAEQRAATERAIVQ